jgi:beta-glucosidase
MPPGLQDLSSAITALKNIFICHGKTYELLHAKDPGVRVGLAHNMAALAPYSAWNPLDRALTKIARKFYNQSLIEAFLTGRLRLVFPFRRPKTLDVPIKGKIDFLGVNYYTRIHLRFNPFKKMGVELKHQDIDGNGLTDLGWEIHPNGLTKVLKYACRLGVPLIITENGIATGDDRIKTRFIRKHVDIVEKCLKQGMDIRGYFYWSLMDNYEWLQGFNARFGLYRVDFDTLERKPTETAAYYCSLIRQKQ